LKWPAAAIMLASLGLLLAGSAAAGARCQGRYRDLALPVYDRSVAVSERSQLTCYQATRVANAVADAYERGLPLADYPTDTGGSNRPFQIRTRSYGTFTCRMIARGSDFVTGRCSDGARFVSFASYNHWFLHDQQGLPELTSHDALNYAITALRRGFKGEFYLGGFSGNCAHRESRTRRSCTVSWYQGDLSFEGRAEIWYRLAHGSATWNYSYDIARLDTYCSQVMHRSMASCTRRFVVH
jgi:hypothetical protein